MPRVHTSKGVVTVTEQFQELPGFPHKKTVRAARTEKSKIKQSKTVQETSLPKTK